jgi:N-sulfoglucosamine sulfohydrolase
VSPPKPLAAPRPAAKSPNVLLITADDMGWDSVGVFGCPLPDITPNIDRLASQGIRFEHAHVNISVCQPCRAVIATGRYSHRNGVKGFRHTHMPIPTVMQTFKDAGYLTGIMSKIEHSTPHRSFEWDMAASLLDIGNGRDPMRYYAYTKRVINESKQTKRPFYLMANAVDPHRVFYRPGERYGALRGLYGPVPSRLYSPEEVPVPGFLPDLPRVRQEVSWYFNCVRRADDMVGQVLRALGETGEESNTIVVFLSDNGMSFPFAKANCYPFSTRTPLIVRWPGVVAPGSVDREHFVSTIDFMPTVLEAARLSLPDGMDGVSFVPILTGGQQPGRELVFTQFYQTAHRRRYPMRCVQDKRICYIFNPWADGERRFRSEGMSGLTFNAMKKASKKDPEVAKRVVMLRRRAREELYDLEKDPNCLSNLIEEGAYRADRDRMRDGLSSWMKKTGDPAIASLATDPKQGSKT